MDSNTLKQVCEKVYKKFPEVKGKNPTKHNQPNNCTLLVFTGVGSTPTGEKIPRIVRVTVNEQGKILKMTTSR